MIDIPASIRVVGTDWTLSIDLDSDHDVDGIVDHDHRTIRLASTASQPTTLLHELLHTLEGALGFSIADHDIHLLARGLTAILKDNPQFKAWLLEKG